MPPFDEAFHVLDDSSWKRFCRDLRLIGWLAKALYGYVVTGRRIRREFRKRKRAGEPYYID